MSGATLTKGLVPLPGGSQATYDPTNSGYRIPDWLGTVRMASNSTRTYSSSQAFAPFGERYSSGGSTPSNYTFTGIINSTVTDEYDFLARSMQTSQGRWISPDPAGVGAANPSNPQSWNRYAYVLNNPMTLTDPLGLATCTGSDGKPVPCADPADNSTTVTATADPVNDAPIGSGSGVIAGFGSVPFFAHLPNFWTNARLRNWGNAANNGTPQTQQQKTQQCLNNFYNSTAGKAVQFGSPLALLPGWNPQWGNNLQEWGIAIVGKLGGLFGSGAMSGTTQLTTLSGTTTVGSTLELGTGAVLGAVEKMAPPAMALATVVDVGAHLNCGPAEPSPDAWIQGAATP